MSLTLREGEPVPIIMPIERQIHFKTRRRHISMAMRSEEPQGVRGSAEGPLDAAPRIAAEALQGIEKRRLASPIPPKEDGQRREVDLRIDERLVAVDLQAFDHVCLS